VLAKASHERNGFFDVGADEVGIGVGIDIEFLLGLGSGTDGDRFVSVGPCRFEVFDYYFPFDFAIILK
jgi:hypothetical protein